MKKGLLLMLSMVLSMEAWSADGDTFTANTTEGVLMTFKVTSEAKLECQVGKGEVYTPCIPSSTSGTVTIPEWVGKGYHVTSIEYMAFYGCSSLSSIIIPNSVTYIDWYVFSNCTGLKTIIIPNSVKTLNNRSFQGCTALKSVTLSENLTAISEGLFSGCSNLSTITIPKKVASVNADAFKNCSKLTSVVSEMTTPSAFGNNAFYGISSTCTLTVPAGTKDAYIAAGWTASVFKGGIIESSNESSPNITFADAYIKELCVANWDTNGDGELSEAEAAAVTDLGSVFSSEIDYDYGYTPKNNITSFDELQYFTGLTTISDDAFLWLIGLTSITIPNSVTSIGTRAFCGCSSLKSITIPSNVTSIRDYTFSGCSGLTSITIPNGVTSIGTCAFAECSSLTSITIPNSVTSIGKQAFSECSGLTSVTIPNSVTSIGMQAFLWCTGLTSVTLGNGVTSIGDEAFGACLGLTSVTIGNSVTSIGSSAFHDCSSLTSITIPNSVTNRLQYFGVINNRA